jgi:hypothetical protein
MSDYSTARHQNLRILDEFEKTFSYGIECEPPIALKKPNITAHYFTTTFANPALFAVSYAG